MPNYSLNTRNIGRMPRSKRLQQLGQGTASASSSVTVNITEIQGEQQGYSVATKDTSGLMSGAMVTQLDFLYNNSWTWQDVLACMDGAQGDVGGILGLVNVCERALALTVHHRRDIVIDDMFPDSKIYPINDTAKIGTLEMYVTQPLRAGQYPCALVQRVTTLSIINADGSFGGHSDRHALIFERSYHITQNGNPDYAYGWSDWVQVEEGGGGGGTVDAYTKAESDAKYATQSELATAFIGSYIWYNNTDGTLHLMTPHKLGELGISIELYHYTRNNSGLGYRYGGWKSLVNLTPITYAGVPDDDNMFHYTVRPVNYPSFAFYETTNSHEEGYSKPTMKGKMAIVITHNGVPVSPFLKFRVVPTRYADDHTKDAIHRYKLSRW